MIDIEGWAHAYSGKVRDLYVPQSAHGFGSGDVMLVVASDRISAFDHVLPTVIPGKGKILTQLSLWWYEKLADIVPNHLVSLDVPEEVQGRAMIVRKLEMVPVECVARGYLSGSGLTEYKSSGGVCGNELPPGLREGDRLPQPIFTPAAKAPAGQHDENITFSQMRRLVGPISTELKNLTLTLYERARMVAAERGLILADTKFEFGLRDDSGSADAIVLADEVLTPDSSRYWAADSWKSGYHQVNFDKQFVRDWLLSPAAQWDRTGGENPPPLPDSIVQRTRERYLEAFERITGRAPDLD
ncbi:MAG: phosphoribosylaminoimidazolesuccinocarboxamide synthase [bacterium]|nr:phosphoribosylaminoimidazolesuccinocarboxamide synthase [bacterium]